MNVILGSPRPTTPLDTAQLEQLLEVMSFSRDEVRLDSGLTVRRLSLPDGLAFYRHSPDAIGVAGSLRLDYLSPQKAATDGLASYPEGYSVMALSSETTWPYQTGLVETWLTDPGGTGHRARQVNSSKTGDVEYVRYSTDGTSWDDWRLLTPAGRSGSTSTAHVIGTTGATETGYTLTISDFPTTRFQARVVATGSCYVLYAAAGSVNQLRLGISLDGGTTWSNSLWMTDSMSSEDYGSLFRSHAASGSVTGTIKVRIQVKSGQLATFDEFEVTAEILTSY